MIGDQHGENCSLLSDSTQVLLTQIYQESGKGDTWLPVIEENKKTAEGSDRKKP